MDPRAFISTGTEQHAVESIYLDADPQKKRISDLQGRFRCHQLLESVKSSRSSTWISLPYHTILGSRNSLWREYTCRSFRDTVTLHLATYHIVQGAISLRFIAPWQQDHLLAATQLQPSRLLEKSGICFASTNYHPARLDFRVYSNATVYCYLICCFTAAVHSSVAIHLARRNYLD